MLGAFRSLENAKLALSRLERAGISAYLQPVATNQGTVFGLRAGPFDSQSAAEEARSRLERLKLSRIGEARIVRRKLDE